MKHCRLEGAIRTVIQVDGVYPCQICSKTNETLDAFKKHIFYKHQNKQVETVYHQSWESLLSQKFLGRQRIAMLNIIVQGKWHEHILAFMNKARPFNLNGVDRTVPICDDTEVREIEKRTCFYRIQMDILKKTATPIQVEKGPEDHQPLMVEYYNDHSLMSWRAAENMMDETFPHQIVQALRLTKQAVKRKYKYIPHFQYFLIANNRLYIQLSSQ